MASTSKPQDFKLELVNGNVKAAMRDAGARSSDLYKVPRASIRVIPGFNLRNIDDPEYKAHLRYLADSILANGFYDDKPLAGYVAREGDKDVIFLTEGHCRLAAFDIAVSEGFNGEMLPMVIKPRGTNTGDLTIAMITGNTGKHFSPYELGIGCKRLIAEGHDEKEIAKSLGMSETYVRGLLDLQAAPAQVRKMVAAGQVSASTARNVVKTHGAKAQQILDTAAKAAKAKGKAKITGKHIRTAVEQTVSPAATPSDIPSVDIREFLRDLQDFSVSAHGSAPQAEQLIEDLTDLLQDLAVAPAAEGWLVAATMAFDGALRSGSTPEEIHTALRHAPALFAVMKALRANTASPSDPAPEHEADALNAEDHV